MHKRTEHIEKAVSKALPQNYLNLNVLRSPM